MCVRVLCVCVCVCVCVLALVRMPACVPAFTCASVCVGTYDQRPKKNRVQ